MVVRDLYKLAASQSRSSAEHVLVAESLPCCEGRERESQRTSYGYRRNMKRNKEKTYDLSSCHSVSFSSSTCAFAFIILDTDGGEDQDEG